MTYRGVIALLGALVLSARSATVEMIADATFAQGYGALDRDGTERIVTWAPGGTSPVWQVRQHHSRSCAADTNRHVRSGDAFVFQDDFAGLAFHRDADVGMALNGPREYDGRFRAQGDPWPHLFLEQRVSNPKGHLGDTSPSLADLRRLDFAVAVRLLHDRANKGDGYNARIHAAQFLFFLTIQNLNRASAGFGDYYWFGVTLYDDREPVTQLHAKLDAGSPLKKGTDKFIYNPGLKPFTDKVVGAGEWVDVRGDLLPHVRAGLREAWGRGHLSASTNEADYRIGGVMMGWEVTGLNDVAMAVRGLSLRAEAGSDP